MTMPDPFPLRLQLLLSAACGLLVANLYYAQPLTGLIGGALGMPAQSVGLLVTLPLAGYGVGLLAIVPLGDLVENRRLVLTLVALEAVCMAAMSLLMQPALFLGAALLAGVTAAAVQVLVPYGSYLAPEERRGKAVARLVSGVMLGIMLARPASSFVAHLLSWHAVFACAAALMSILFITLYWALPARQPSSPMSYRRLLLSMGSIFTDTEVLRRRALYHACMFGAFSVFWTAIPLWLSGPRFHLTQEGIAWVAFAGVAGAVAPPFAARMADRQLGQLGTALAMLLATAAFLLTLAGTLVPPLSLAAIVAAAILLDFAVSAHLVFGQRAIFALAAEQRSRINGLFMATFFAGGAAAAALGAWLYATFGWVGAATLGAALPMLALLYFATEHADRSTMPGASTPASCKGSS